MKLAHGATHAPASLLRKANAPFIYFLALGLAGCADEALPQHQNQAPTATNTSIELVTEEDMAASIEVEAMDPDDDPLTFVASSPSHGSVTGEAQSFVYTPALDYAGEDSFTITVSDGSTSITIPISITVTAVNDAPIATDVSATLGENTPGTILLEATDVDDEAFTFVVVDEPLHGTLSGTAPNLTYTPGTNFEGEDSFTFRAADATATSNIATVRIHVTHTASCGDGLRESTEACDDGNTSDSDACLSDCTLATCGDGFVRAGIEQCDDGNSSNNDACLNSCAYAVCGDGFVYSGVEQCDDGNANNDDACRNTCRSPI